MTATPDTDALKLRIGARLRALRRAREESGARRPSVPLLSRYAEALEVPIYELLRFDEPALTLG